MYFYSRNTGLLTLEDSPHENILKMKRHLEGLNADFKYLDRDGLKQKFPMLQHLATYNAVYEPTGGMLRADKCCAVLQVTCVFAGTIKLQTLLPSFIFNFLLNHF